jgi:protein involved in polysaccharide export with SLBB domain
MSAYVYRLFAAFVLVTALAGCQSDLKNLPPVEPTALDDASYRLRPGDKLSLVVFGVKDLSGEIQIAAEGTIALPLVDNVKVAGLTIAELTDAVREKLMAGYLRDPKVTIQIVNYRPFYILGEVRTPGGYPFVPGMTVTNAIALAGGYTPRAYKDLYRVTRGGASFRADDNTKLLPDDVISVSERYF